MYSFVQVTSILHSFHLVSVRISLASSLECLYTTRLIHDWSFSGVLRCFWTFFQLPWWICHVLFFRVSFTLACSNYGYTISSFSTIVTKHRYFSSLYKVRNTSPFLFLFTCNFAVLWKEWQLFHWNTSSFTNSVSYCFPTCAKTIRNISTNFNSITTKIEDSYKITN